MTYPCWRAAQPDGHRLVEQLLKTARCLEGEENVGLRRRLFTRLSLRAQASLTPLPAQNFLDAARTLALEPPPPGVPALDWWRLRRFATPYPGRPGTLAPGTEQQVGSLVGFLNTAQLAEYAAGLQAAGLRLEDAPFLDASTLKGELRLITKTFHVKRFERHAAALATLPPRLAKEHELAALVNGVASTGWKRRTDFDSDVACKCK
eukprot:SAG11_NODE_708_length_7648_cov_3.486687_7_plen_206_part_00